MRKYIWVWVLLLSVCIQAFATHAAAAATMTTRCDLRLRKEASTNSGILVTVPGGTELTIEGRSGGWSKTSYNGHTGYVSTSYLMELTRSGYYPLKEGDNNPYVQQLQKKLMELGYFTGIADGVYEKSTTAAVSSFQKANKLKQDGIAGGETQRIMYTGDTTVAVSDLDTNAQTGTPAPSATPRSALLKKGDKGDSVRELQNRLIELGYLSGKADGVYGTSTENAVKAFQKVSRLASDGKAGSVTQAVLYANGALKADGSVARPSETASPANASGSGSYATLKRGMTSDDVKDLQQALKDLGYFPSSTKVTGYYGSQTQLAVQKFQKASSLAQDGIAGKNTLEKLYGASAKPSAPSSNGNGAVPDELTRHGVLKEGMKSTAVKTLQTKLKSLGYLSENATGYFGSATKKAVVSFQKASKISADGIVGSATLKALYSENPAVSGGGGSGSTVSGAGKISGPAASSVKLLHWANSVKPSLNSNSVVLVFDPVSKYAFNIKSLSLGRHFDSEPLTAEDTKYMNAAFGGVTTWTPKPVWVKLPSGTWTLATMHNVPHLSGSVSNNNFDGHLCIHFLRDMAEAQKNDPKYGVQHQKAIRDAWLKLSGQTVK